VQPTTFRHETSPENTTFRLVHVFGMRSYYIYCRRAPSIGLSVNMLDDICMTNKHTWVHMSYYYNNSYRARCVHTRVNGMTNELFSARARKLTCVKPNDSRRRHRKSFVPPPTPSISP